MNPEFGWTETEFRTEILAKCEELGLVVNYHKLDKLSPVRGWPDLEIIGPCGICYRELKTMTGVLSVDQRRIGSKLAKADADWAVWRPVDWLSGIIASQLSKLAGKDY